MDIEIYREYCLSKSFVTEEFPFDRETLVFKVKGKIFALCGISNFKSVNLKCDPDRAVELREQFDAVIPGYHMNKKHWNTLHINRYMQAKVVQGFIQQSYHLVRKK